MSRKPKYKKRIISPDRLYSNKLISKFINHVMLDGKKSIAEKMVYESLEILSKKVANPVLESFVQAIDTITPRMEVKSRRVGGSTYQVPVEVQKKRGYTLAMKWIIENARKKTGVAFSERLSSELIDAYNNTGNIAKKRDDTHKMAEANKAFSHFRW
ncbi:30S ribosomal protein S7 [Candidatus Marinamargulisbacteria bacterium SCGC AG-333-B06]|nr:30S ribosomal protein S7 [Candidatus Marinamargulisbacteria bacterium SCGC AG-333-B06]